MTQPSFTALWPEIQHFIHLRRLSGTDYQSQAQLLGYFDRFLLAATAERTPHYPRDHGQLSSKAFPTWLPAADTTASAWSDSCASTSPPRSPQLCARTLEGNPLARGSPALYLQSTLRSRRSWRPPANCRRPTRFGLTPTARFWGFSTARGSGSARLWP